MLIHEIVVRDDEPSVLNTTSDMHMMMVLSAAECTEGQWRRIMDEAGLAVVRIWESKGRGESIIEAVVR